MEDAWQLSKEGSDFAALRPYFDQVQGALDRYIAQAHLAV
jgi:hypothetical protein